MDMSQSMNVSRTLRGLLPRRLACCSRLRDEGGNALIELALLLSFLGVPMLLGTIELGVVVYSTIEVSDAASAGALFGMQNSGYAANTAGIVSVAQADAPEYGTNLNVTPFTYYACTTAVGGTQYPTTSYTQAQATTACSGSGNEALEFLQVTTRATVTPAIVLPGLPKTYTVTGKSVLEVEK